MQNLLHQLRITSIFSPGDFVLPPFQPILCLCTSIRFQQAHCDINHIRSVITLVENCSSTLTAEPSDHVGRALIALQGTELQSMRRAIRKGNEAGGHIGPGHELHAIRTSAAVAGAEAGNPFLLVVCYEPMLFTTWHILRGDLQIWKVLSELWRIEEGTGYVEVNASTMTSGP